MIRRSKVSKHLEQGGSGNIARFSWLVVVMPGEKEKRPDCKKGGVNWVVLAALKKRRGN